MMERKYSRERINEDKILSSKEFDIDTESNCSDDSEETEKRIHQGVEEYLEYLFDSPIFPCPGPIDVENFTSFEKDTRSISIIYESTNLIKDVINIISDYCQVSGEIDNSYTVYNFGNDIIKINHHTKESDWIYRQYSPGYPYKWYFLLWVNRKNGRLEYVAKGEGGEDSKYLSDEE